MAGQARHGWHRSARGVAALALAGSAACGTVSSTPAVAPRPDEAVIVHFDPPRELRLERAPGDTVRVRAATSVVGRLRAVRGDTSWIVASRVRALHDDGQGAVPGWTVAVVNDGRTQVVAISRDTYTDRKGARQLGKLAAIGATVGAVVTLYFLWVLSSDPS